MHLIQRLICLTSILLVPLFFAGAAHSGIYSPVSVELIAPQLPAVGDTVTIDCVVESDDYFDDVSVEISLSDGLELVGGSLLWRARMAAHEQAQFTIAVRVTTAGNHKVRADAIAQSNENASFGDTNQIFFNSGTQTASKGHVFDYVHTMTPSASAQTGEIVQPTKLSEYRVSAAEPSYVPEPCTAGPGDSQIQDNGPVPQGLLTVTGKWYYYNRDGVYRPMEWVYVELIRGDNNAVLASAYVTDNDGRYTFPAVTNPGSAGFRVRVYCYHSNTNSSDGKALRVVDVGRGRDDGGNVHSAAYSAQTGVRTSGDGSYDMGAWNIIKGSTNEPAWWLMMDLNKGFWWPYWWNNHTTMNGGVTVEWSSTSTHGDHNHRTDDGGNIHLQAASADVSDVVLHEYGHEVQWDGYGQWLPTSDCPSPHYVQRISGTNCAWIEGFANWYKCVVTNDPVFHWPSGATLNLEDPTWGSSGWDNGDKCEGRVAGALWDLGDSAVDGIDTAQLDWKYIWDTWYGSANRDSTFAQFWTRWKNRGNPKHHATKALYQNTINYNHAPVFGGLPNVTTAEDTPKYNAINLKLYASDQESAPSELEYTIVGNTNPSCGAFIVSGSWVWVVPDANWHGSSNVTVRCSDGITSKDAMFTVTVTPVNDAPVLSGIPDKVVEVNSTNPRIIDPYLYASDVDNSVGSLTYTIVGNTDSQCGVSIDYLDYISINPTPGWTGYSDVTIRATDPGGLWDEDTFRIVVANPYSRISQARDNADGTWVWLTQKIVTGRLADASYIEEMDRTAGIRIQTTDSIYQGQVLTVAGRLSTSFAERTIYPYIHYATGGTNPPKPLAMTNDSLGGGSPNSHTSAVPPLGSGAYNVGLLVRTTGRVKSHINLGRYYISDGGSVIDNASGKATVMVQAVPSGWQPPIGSYVTVTGISGASTLSNVPMRTLRPRTDDDVRINSLRVAYLHAGNITEAQSYKTLLDSHGLLTDLVGLIDIESADLSGYQVVVIGSDVTAWNNNRVNAVLAANTPIIARGAGGASFLNYVPDLFVRGAHSWTAINQMYVIRAGGNIYNYPYQIPAAVGNAIYVANTPGVTARSLYDPDGISNRILRQYDDTTHYPVASERDRFYMWGFEGPPSSLTALGQQLFVNLVYGSVRP